MAESTIVAAPDEPILLETPTVMSVSGTASAATALSVNHDGQVFFTFICDQQLFIKIGGSGVAAPDETATTGDGRCWDFPANQLRSVKLVPGQTHIRVKAAAAGKLRYQVEEVA